MKATDFDLSKGLKFDITKGYTTFESSRLIIIDANAMGLLKKSIIDEIGWAKARKMFLKFGFQNGYSDFMQMKLSFKFDTEMDLLASGPVIHTWEGIVHAVPKELKIDRKTGQFYFTGIWENSYEAEQYLSYNKPAKEPVCWSLMGYASGWSSAFWGSLLIAIEPVCAGKGDDHCEWKIMPPADWGKEGEEYLKIYQEIKYFSNCK